MIISHSSQFEEAKVADTTAGIPLRWLREVDLACDAWLVKKGIHIFSFRESISFSAATSVGARHIHRKATTQ